MFVVTRLEGIIWFRYLVILLDILQKFDMNESFSTNPDGPVLVIGAAGVDVVGRLRGDLRVGASSPASIRNSFGGVSRNIAENLARLGHAVTLLAVVGDDLPGDHLIKQLALSGVDTHAILKTPTFPTGSYMGTLSMHGELKYALDDMRIMSQLSSEYLRQNEDMFKQASVVFVDANLSKKTLRTALSLARKAKIPICADPAAVSLSERLLPFLPRFSLITPNIAEASVLSGLQISPANRQMALKAAKYFVGQGIQIAIISMAQFGVCYATSETSGHIPSIRSEIIDPTGVGDAMTAAVIFALLNDMPVDDAVRLGVSAASLTLRYNGTVLPDLTLEKLYDQLVI